MAAYFVVMQHVHDTDRYLNEYVPRVMPFLEKHGGEVLAAGFEGEALEGDPPNSTVVIRFPDAASARAFLDDPDYQPVRELRYSITSGGRTVVMPEYTPNR